MHTLWSTMIYIDNIGMLVVLKLVCKKFILVCPKLYTTDKKLLKVILN